MYKNVSIQYMIEIDRRYLKKTNIQKFNIQIFCVGSKQKNYIAKHEKKKRKLLI